MSENDEIVPTFPLILVNTLSKIVVKSPSWSFGNPYPKSNTPSTLATVPDVLGNVGMEF